MSNGAKIETDMKNKYHPIAGGRNYHYRKGEGEVSTVFGPVDKKQYLAPSFLVVLFMWHGIESTLKY
jgi:hypothetical protein